MLRLPPPPDATSPPISERAVDAALPLDSDRDGVELEVEVPEAVGPDADVARTADGTGANDGHGAAGLAAGDQGPVPGGPLAPAFPAPTPASASAAATAALALGVAALASVAVPLTALAALPLGAAATALGIVGIAEGRDGRRGTARATLGLATGVLGLLGALLWATLGPSPLPADAAGAPAEAPADQETTGEPVEETADEPVEEPADDVPTGDDPFEPSGEHVTFSGTGTARVTVDGAARGYELAACNAERDGAALRVTGEGPDGVVDVWYDGEGVLRVIVEPADGAERTFRGPLAAIEHTIDDELDIEVGATELADDETGETAAVSAGFSCTSS